MDDLIVESLPQGDLVLCLPREISADHRAALAAQLEQRLQGRTVLVLDGGAQLLEVGQSVQLKRIERKLDALIMALGEDPDADEDAVRTLDGGLLNRPRGEGQPL